MKQPRKDADWENFKTELRFNLSGKETDFESSSGGEEGETRCIGSNKGKRTGEGRVCYLGEEGFNIMLPAPNSHFTEIKD